MPDRKPYQRRFTVLPGWTLKAIGLVMAGAATMIVALTVARHLSIESDSPQDGKLVRAYHEAVTLPPGAESSGADPGTAASPDTVMHDGLTVISPELLVPVIDLASLEAASKASANNTSSARKRSRYAKRSHSRRQTHWKAYGLAIR